MAPPKFNPNAAPFVPPGIRQSSGQPTRYNNYAQQARQSSNNSVPPMTFELPAELTGTHSPASAVHSGVSTPNRSTTSLSSLSSALSEIEETPATPFLAEIAAAKTSPEARKAASALAETVAQFGPSGIQLWQLPHHLRRLAKQKSSPAAKEGAMAAITALARSCTDSPPHEAFLVSLWPAPFDLLADKDAAVKRAAQTATEALYAAFPTPAVPKVVLPALLSVLDSSAKWQAKIAALKLIDRITADVAPDLLETTFPAAIPVLTSAMTDFKPELARAAGNTTADFVAVLDNLDLGPRYKLIIQALADPNQVEPCIKALSQVTFVAEVTAPALALLVPILVRALNRSSTSQDLLRQTVVVAENLTRLVNDPREVKPFIPQLLPGVRRVVETAAQPEVRQLAEKALTVLEAADSEEEMTRKVLAKRFEPQEVAQRIVAQSEEELQYAAAVVATLANSGDWKALETFVTAVSGPEAASLASELRAEATVTLAATDDDEGVEIVNTDFSLAYGGRMLLNKTTLRLLKGHRYGLCGRNGAGKSTLMRSIAQGKLDGFPDKSELRTCFVEHKLQGSEADMDLVAFIASDAELQGSTKEEISAALAEVGFDEERRAQNVGSLSGGWKMKLELARAMLMKADILLLDEPTNHLDVTNVKWLQDYLLAHTDITSLIVSHDSSFLDAVCTDIIHYENRKLAYYKGNLSEFVKVKPEGKSYYTLTDSNVKMHFPSPGLLAGVKSNTRAVARLANVTFTYPGASKPSLKNVSCSLSLSSRVAILGANGAGKSTLIKLLTGETVPDSGRVEKHPNLRIGYIAQHALQHVEQHKEKTANQYLQWRYKFGEDREVLLKESRKISAGEEAQMAKEIDIGDGRGPRAIEAIVGRQKLKKSFQYEVKWKFWLPKYNSWVPREKLIEEGFGKLVQRFDDHEASREGLGYRELVPSVISKHFEDVGLDSEIADHTPLGSLSGGQLVKVVIAGAMWNKPHLLVLDEPTNYLDRDSLGGLAMAIREWNGGVVMISHNSEFVGALCPEQWIIQDGEVVQKGVVAVDSGRFEDQGGESGESASSSAASSAVPSRSTTPAPEDDSPANIKVRQRKKKLTRNQIKERDARRRARYLEWLSSPKGTPRPPDTDDEGE